MNLTLSGARREKKERRNLIRRIKNLIVSIRKLTSVMTAVFVVPLSLTPFLIGQKTEIDSTATKVPEIEISVASPSVFKTEIPSSKIVIGESNADKEARLKIEAALQAERQRQKEEESRKRTVVSRERRDRNTESAADFSDLYRRAENSFGVDARLLQAVHYVETGLSDSTSRRNASGATGPMQFMPGTWKNNGVDGNGDGRADITNVEDSVFTAARFLKASGYPNTRQALWSYNPSKSYYNKVMEVAKSLGY